MAPGLTVWRWPRGHASAARPMGHAHAALRPIGPCGLAVQMPVFIVFFLRLWGVQTGCAGAYFGPATAVSYALCKSRCSGAHACFGAEASEALYKLNPAVLGTAWELRAARCALYKHGRGCFVTCYLLHLRCPKQAPNRPGLYNTCGAACLKHAPNQPGLYKCVSGRILCMQPPNRPQTGRFENRYP